MTYRMAPADAQMYWLSAKIPNDQFLVYGFAGECGDVADAVADVVARARGCPALRLRVEESGCALRYPRWVSGDVAARQIVTHRLAEPDWLRCLDAVAQLADDQLDLRRMSWRLHVFPSVVGVPGAAAAATVTVLQMGHPLGDGIRSADLAGVLFGRGGAVPEPPRQPSGWLVARATEAARTHRQLERDTARGVIPPAAPSRPVLTTNTRPTGRRFVRTLMRRRPQLPGPTVTVGALTAISTALSGYLSSRGEDTSTLAAEVPMAKDGAPLAHNHFGNVSVGLYATVSATDERARLIAAELAERRRRGQHPAFAAADRAFATVPAPLMRWGVAQFDANARSSTVTGNTVVSSVNRGPADLTFGGHPVIFTSGYPALSPMMGLTHGVHGIGDTVAISVHTAESVLDDVDEYLDRLDTALGKDHR